MPGIISIVAASNESEDNNSDSDDEDSEEEVNSFLKLASKSNQVLLQSGKCVCKHTVYTCISNLICNLDFIYSTVKILVLFVQTIDSKISNLSLLYQPIKIICFRRDYGIIQNGVASKLKIKCCFHGLYSGIMTLLLEFEKISHIIHY